MFHYMVLVSAVALAGWSVAEPQRAGWWFVAFVGLLEGWLLLVEWARRPNHLCPAEPPQHFTAEEIVVLRNYPLFFQYPLVARQISTGLLSIQVVSVPMVAWLLFEHQWWQAGLISSNFLVLGPLALRLHPVPFLKRSAASGQSTASEHLAVVEPLLEKLHPSGGTSVDA